MGLAWRHEDVCVVCEGLNAVWQRRGGIVCSVVTHLPSHDCPNVGFSMATSDCGVSLLGTFLVSGAPLHITLLSVARVDMELVANPTSTKVCD